MWATLSPMLRKPRVGIARMMPPGTRPVQTLGQIGFGSDQGRVMGHLSRPILDPCLVSSRVGLARASMFDMSGFFGLGRVFLALGRVFSGWVGFWVKNHVRIRLVNYFE
jgi:hypothetical protein